MKKIYLSFLLLFVISGSLIFSQNSNDITTSTKYVLLSGSVGTQITICRNGLNKLIPDNSAIGVYDTITLSIPNACEIIDVNIKIDTILHTWVSDLVFSVTHNTVKDSLFRNQGGSSHNIIGVTFNDSATPPPPPPFINVTIRPYRPLSMFNGGSTNGTWVLHIVDGIAADTGYLRGWCVQIVYQDCLGIKSGNEIPQSFYLSQNYPNPFNPATTIYYGIPKSEYVSLKVYDILGKEIASLVNKVQSSGTYEVDWDGTNYPSGVYFYELEVRQAAVPDGRQVSATGNYHAVKKMVLVK